MLFFINLPKCSRTNFKVSLVTEHQYYFLHEWFIVKGQPGTWKWPRCPSGRWRWQWRWQADTELCWWVTAPHWWPGPITEQGLPVSRFTDPLIWGEAPSTLLTNLGVLPMSREKDASEQMCVSLPEPALTSSRTPLRLLALLTAGCDVQVPRTFNFKFL